MPQFAFKELDDQKSTITKLIRDLNYAVNNLDQINVATTTLVLGADQVKASNIDFGVGANQVDAADIPVTDSSGYYIATTVEGVLTEIGGYINYLSTHLSYSTNTLSLDSTGIINLRLNSSTLASLSTEGFLVSGKFACNGESLQGKYSVSTALSTAITGSTTLALNVALNSDLVATNTLLNEIRTALINNGICV
jgi:hypothetical protein